MIKHKCSHVIFVCAMRLLFDRFRDCIFGYFWFPQFFSSIFPVEISIMIWCWHAWWCFFLVMTMHLYLIWFFPFFSLSVFLLISFSRKNIPWLNFVLFLSLLEMNWRRFSFVFFCPLTLNNFPDFDWRCFLACRLGTSSFLDCCDCK